jgi:hypothetical protein
LIYLNKPIEEPLNKSHARQRMAQDLFGSLLERQSQCMARGMGAIKGERGVFPRYSTLREGRTGKIRRTASEVKALNRGETLGRDRLACRPGTPSIPLSHLWERGQERGQAKASFNQLGL